MTKKTQLFISDLDGTIIETEDYHRMAYNALFSELGLSKNWSKQEYIDRLQTMGGNKFREVLSWLDLPEEEYEEAKKRLYEHKTQLYVDLITTDLQTGKLTLRPGVRRFFDDLRKAAIPIAIATACVGWAAERVVEAALGLEFLKSLTCLCGGESTRHHKPAPDIYLLVAERSGVDAHSCVVLEDTWHGMTAAKEAGMICITTPSEFAQEHDFSRADLLLRDLESPTPFLVEHLDKLFKS